MKKHLWIIGYSAALTAFTIYITLDTFVLTKSYTTNASAMSASAFEDLEAAADNSAASSSSTSDTPIKQESQGDGTHKHRKHPDSESVNTNTVSEVEASNETSSSIDASDSYTGDTTYSDDNITINLSEYDQYNTKIYVADVTLSSAEYLKTAFANDTYGKNITATTSEMAEENSAILAINGDFYGVQESGYVIRNGIVYRSEGDGSEVLCIYANGTMDVINDSEYTTDELIEKGVWQAFSFGPGLIENGVISVDTDDEVDMAKASNPRTAIGIIDTNHYVFVVSDGRTSESEGLSLYELAEFMQNLGVTTAYNLDGGGSSTMYFNGQIVNNPTSGRSIKERGVSDIVYIA